MFGNLGLHVIKFPSGRFGFVGSIPLALGYDVPATTAAIMGGRTYTNAAGECVERKFPTFETETEAREFAKSKGF
jgi:hypothetical protein